MFYPEDNTKAILATEMGIYETSLINGGSTAWSQNSGFPVVRTDMLQYRKSDGTVLAATHGRGLWTSQIPFTNPYVRFATNYNFKTEATATSGSVCRNYTDYTVNMTIDQAPTGAANITLTPSGTATQGVDYDFTTNGNFAAPSSVVTFASGSTTPVPITIRIYNDAEIESTESFTLTYSIGGGTNAVAAPSSSSYTFTIVDNDVAPAEPSVPVTATIGVSNTTLSQPFRGEFTDARTQMVYLASELKAAGFNAGTVTSISLNVSTKVSTAPFNSLTIKMKNTTTGSLVGGGNAFEGSLSTVFGPVNYSTVVGSNTFTLSSAFVWDGTSNILVDMCFDNTSAAGATADLVDGTSGTATEQHDRVNGGVGCSLTTANTIFGGYARPVMTFTINPTGNAIETVLNNNRSEYTGSNGTYYFYNGNNIINSLTNATADLGCVSSNIFEAGNTWQAFSGGFRSQKVIEVTPTTNPGATYTIGLYFTAAELSTYSGTPGALMIAKTTAATMAAANSGNTVKMATTPTAYGTGYIFTATFTGFSKFFLVDNNVSLPVTLLDFSGRLENKFVSLKWSTSTELNSKYFDVEKSPDGTDFHSIGQVDAAGYSTVQRNYGMNDRQVNEYNYYRLKMVDIDGRFVYSKIILIKNPNAQQNVWVINNPFHSFIDVRFAKTPQQKIQVELLNMAGARVYFKEFGIGNEVRVDLSNTHLSAASYMLRTRVDGKWYLSKVVKQ